MMIEDIDMKTHLIAAAMAASVLIATTAQASESTAHIDHAQDANWAATMSRIVKLSMAQNGGNVSRTRVCEPSRKTCTSSVNYFNTDGIYAFLAVIRDSNGRPVNRSACHLNKEADVLSCTDFDTSEKTVSRKNGSGDWTSIVDNNAKPPAYADPIGTDAAGNPVWCGNGIKHCTWAKKPKNLKREPDVNSSVMYGNTPQPSLQSSEGVLGASLASSADTSDNFPVKDIDAVCRKALSQTYLGDGQYSGEASQAAVNECIDFIQPYYDSGKVSWNDASLSDRKECLSEANSKSRGGTDYGFYAFLSQCFDAKEQQADMKSQHHFNAW
jgi:hypothetical protein